MSKTQGDGMKIKDATATTPQTRATIATGEPTPTGPAKRNVCLLYDGSYESAFLVTRLARDYNSKDPEILDKDFNLKVLVPHLDESDTQTLAKLKEIVGRENPSVEFVNIAGELDICKPDKDKILKVLETALKQTLAAGANVLKVAWTKDRINSNKDIFQHILMVKAPILINNIEDAIPENQQAAKENKPKVKSVGIDWANFGRDDLSIHKQKANLGLQNIFKEAAGVPQINPNEPQPLGA